LDWSRVDRRGLVKGSIGGQKGGEEAAMLKKNGNIGGII